MAVTDIRYIPIDTRTVNIWETSNEWALLCVKKETSGTVTIGTQDGVSPNRGQSLSTDVPIYLLISPGASVYAVAPDNQAISLAIQPLPAIFEILGALQKLVGMTSNC